MFSQACVKNSVHQGWGGGGPCRAGGAACVRGTGAWMAGVRVARGACMAGEPHA